MADEEAPLPCMRALARPSSTFLIYGPNNVSSGIMINFLETFTSHYNICYTLAVRSHMAWGNIIPENKTFTGSLGLLQKSYDVFLNPVFSNTERLKYFEHSNMVDMSPLTALYAYPNVEPDLAGFVKVFDRLVWIVIGIALLVALGCTIGFLLVQEKLLSGRSVNGAMDYSTPIHRAFILVSKSFLSQNIQNPNKQLKALTIFIGGWLLMCLFLSHSYRCNLKAALIIPKVKIPFNNVNEMFEQNQLQWMISYGTVFQKEASISPPNSTLGKLYAGLGRFIRSPAVEVMPLLATRKYTYIVQRNVAMGYVSLGVINNECTITIMKEAFWYRPTFIVMNRNFDKRLKKMLIQTHRRLQESGIYDYWVRKDAGAMTFSCVRNVGKDNPQNRPLVLEDLIGVFSILLAGYCLALITFLFELIYTKCFRK